MGYRLEPETPLADVVYSVAGHAKNLRVTEYKYCVIERMHDDFIVFENERTNDSRTLRIDTVRLRKDSAFEESVSSAGIQLH
jgi:hypothetical protein